MMYVVVWWIYIIIWIGSCCFGGLIGYLIGKGKGINGFWWGFFLGWIGWIVVACMEDKNAIPHQTIVVSNNYNRPGMNNNVNQQNKYEKIEQLDKLRKIGAITEEEFEDEKRKILN